MSSRFAEMKKNKANRLATLTKKVEESTTNTKSFADERFWAVERDKQGNGYAIVRFLPEPEGEEDCWVARFHHAFKGPTGSWYYENSLTTIGQADPVGEANKVLWNSGLDSDKDKARAHKRKLTHYSNVLVVKDPAHPENEGKVFLFKFGKKIFDHIEGQMAPEFQDDVAMNPFCPFDGANFKIKIRIFEDYPNYDKCEFELPSPLAASDDEMEAIMKQCHSLQAFLSPDEFKSYDELERKFNKVMSGEVERNIMDDPNSVAETTSASVEEQPTPDLPAEKMAEDGDKLSGIRKLVNR